MSGSRRSRSLYWQRSFQPPVEMTSQVVSTSLNHRTWEDIWMASSEEYFDFIIDQLSLADGITARKMMGEYLLYCNGKLFGGIYDDRFLVKPTKSALEKMPEARRELPYDGAKEMLLVEEVDDREFLRELVTALCAKLPEPKRKK